MNNEDLIRARKRAEKVVEDMPEGALKVKAFELAFEEIVRPANGGRRVKSKKSDRQGSREARETVPTTGPARILSLKDDGFFAEQRNTSQVVDELKAHGWHYPSKTIATRLQELVQQRKLRRVIVNEGKKKVWKYSNP